MTRSLISMLGLWLTASHNFNSTFCIPMAYAICVQHIPMEQILQSRWEKLYTYEQIVATNEQFVCMYNSFCSASL
jgi:Na+-transporting methylmalonyl-CoA/oxaloacetate decarboxylase beta subunit